MTTNTSTTMSDIREASGRPSPAPRLPAEWEPHAQCWMAWPEREDVWPNGGAGAREAVVCVVRAIAAYEPVSVLATDGRFDEAKAALNGIQGVRVARSRMNDIWLVSFAIATFNAHYPMPAALTPTAAARHRTHVRGAGWGGAGRALGLQRVGREVPALGR